MRPYEYAKKTKNTIYDQLNVVWSESKRFVWTNENHRSHLNFLAKLSIRIYSTPKLNIYFIAIRQTLHIKIVVIGPHGFSVKFVGITFNWYYSAIFKCYKQRPTKMPYFQSAFRVYAGRIYGTLYVTHRNMCYTIY